MQIFLAMYQKDTEQNYMRAQQERCFASEIRNLYRVSTETIKRKLKEWLKESARSTQD